MKAIQFTEYGSPDVLKLTEVEKPSAKEGEIVVKVHAASANPLDWHRMRGEPFLARLDEGWNKPGDPGIGSDIAGVVEAVGRGVTRFKPGDAVFGAVWKGGFAEYACAPEDKFALKPANISYEEASAAPVVGLTALQGLRDTGKIQAGQKVLVNGASGGVGTFAVQIAKTYGTEVTGVCSTRNLEMVRSIGADHMIDYTKEDFTRSGQQYDLIYCAVGNRSLADYRRALKPNGICAIAGFTVLPRLFEHMILGSLTSMFNSKKVGLMGTAQVKTDDLEIIADLLGSGKVVPAIDKHYALTETAEAIRYLETSRARGKVVINVA